MSDEKKDKTILDLVGANLEGDVEVIKMKQNLEKAKKAMPILIESMACRAEMKRAEYESWLEVGFTEEQALNLIKDK